MVKIVLDQNEADELFALAKARVDGKEYIYPHGGGRLTIPLAPADSNCGIQEEFSLDVSRGKIELTKGTCQNRTRQAVILARLDFGGAPHRNPDGEDIPCPHLHLYREGYNDKWAIVLPEGVFQDISNPWVTLQDFIDFCNIVVPPIIAQRLL